MRRALAALALALASQPGAAAPPPAPARFEVRLEPASITVGDPVTVTARLRAPGLPHREAPVALANVGATWGKAVVLEPPRLERVEDASGRQLVWTFRITAFETGRLELPAVEARFDLDPPRSERSQGPLALEVRSVLDAKRGDLAPAPPAPPRPLPLPAAFWALLGGLAAAVAVAAIALARRPLTGLSPALHLPPPLAELESALAALSGAEPLADHRRLSSAVRRFLGRRCGFPALESTTTEVARRLAARGVDPELARRARRLLAGCDGVKFARRTATAGELLGRRDEAVALARAVEAAFNPPAPPEAAR